MYISVSMLFVLSIALGFQCHGTELVWETCWQGMTWCLLCHTDVCRSHKYLFVYAIRHIYFLQHQYILITYYVSSSNYLQCIETVLANFKEKRILCCAIDTGIVSCQYLVSMVLHSGHDLCRWTLKTLVLPLHNVIVKQFQVDYFCLESPAK